MSSISFPTNDSSPVFPTFSAAPVALKWNPPAIADPFLRTLQNEYSNWERFKDCFRKKSPIRRSIENMSQCSDLSKQWDTNLRNIVKALNSVDYHCLRPNLRQIFGKMSSEQMTQLFDRLIKQGIKGKGMEGLQNCLRIIPLDELKGMMQEALITSGMTSDEAIQSMALAEKEYKKIITTSAESTLKQHGKSVKDIFHGIMDTLLMAMSFLDMGKEPSSTWEAAHLLDIYGKIISAPLIIFTAIVAMTSFLTALASTTAIVLCIALALFAYIKWLKPCPENVEPCKNLLTAALKGELAPVLARQKEIDEVLNYLAASTDTHRAHPVLCGKSGIGKSEIVKGVAQRLASGDVPDCLKGKKLFIVNTAELVEKGAYDSVDKLRKCLIASASTRKMSLSSLMKFTKRCLKYRID